MTILKLQQTTAFISHREDSNASGLKDPLYIPCAKGHGSVEACLNSEGLPGPIYKMRLPKLILSFGG